MTRKIANVLILLVFLCFGLTASAQKPGEKTSAKSDLPKVVAKVNGTDITRDDLEQATQAAAAQLQMMGGQLPSGNQASLQRGVLDDLIAMELLSQEARKRKLSPSGEEVDKRLGEFKAMFPSEAVFNQALAQRGVTTDDVKKDLSQQLAISKLLEKEVESKIKIPANEVESFYSERKSEFKQPERAKAAHILVKAAADASEADRAAARKKAESLAKRAKKGEDFAKLAKENSDDPGSKEKGGDLGEFSRSEMVKPFADAVFSMKPGQISDVVESRFGYHVIKLESTKPAGTIPLKEVRKDIEEYLKLQKSNEMAKSFVEKLRKQAKVQTFL
jgi:peptidyl-prolyl cis-trans isomerase C